MKKIVFQSSHCLFFPLYQWQQKLLEVGGRRLFPLYRINSSKKLGKDKRVLY